MHLYEKRPLVRWRGLIVSLALCLAILLLFSVMLTRTGERNEQEQATILENAIRNAAVSAYATEGRYPPSLEKIVEDYGILINTDQFIVYYQIFASNIMPEISVVFKGERGT